MPAVPPRNRPWSTLPFLSSKVSAAATLTKNNATAMAAKKRFKFRILPSLVADSQSHVSRTSPQRNATRPFYWIGYGAPWNGCVRRPEPRRAFDRGPKAAQNSRFSRTRKGPKPKLEPFVALETAPSFVGFFRELHESGNDGAVLAIRL